MVQKKAWEKSKEKFTQIVSKIVGVFTGIKDKISGYFSKAWDAVKSAWKDPKTFFSNVISKILDTFKNLPSNLKDVGTNLVKGLWKGISDMTSWIVGKVKGFGGNVLGGIKKFFGIHSPSTVMAEVGGYMAEGMAQGIEEGAGKVEKASKKLGDSVNKGLEGSGNKKDTFDKLNKNIDKQKKTLESLATQYKSAVMIYGELSDEAIKYAEQIKKPISGT